MVANRRMLAVFLERRRVGCRTIGNVHGKRMYNTTLFGMLIYILSATGFIRHTTAAPLARRNNGSPECNTEAEEVGCPGYILKHSGSSAGGWRFVDARANSARLFVTNSLTMTMEECLAECSTYTADVCVAAYVWKLNSGATKCIGLTGSANLQQVSSTSNDFSFTRWHLPSNTTSSKSNSSRENPLGDAAAAAAPTIATAATTTTTSTTTTSTATTTTPCVRVDLRPSCEQYLEMGHCNPSSVLYEYMALSCLGTCTDIPCPGAPITTTSTTTTTSASTVTTASPPPPESRPIITRSKPLSSTSSSTSSTTSTEAPSTARNATAEGQAGISSTERAPAASTAAPAVTIGVLDLNSLGDVVGDGDDGGVTGAEALHVILIAIGASVLSTVLGVACVLYRYEGPAAKRKLAMQLAEGLAAAKVQGDAASMVDAVLGSGGAEGQEGPTRPQLLGLLQSEEGLSAVIREATRRGVVSNGSMGSRGSGGSRGSSRPNYAPGGRGQNIRMHYSDGVVAYPREQPQRRGSEILSSYLATRARSEPTTHAQQKQQRGLGRRGFNTRRGAAPPSLPGLHKWTPAAVATQPHGASQRPREHPRPASDAVASARSRAAVFSQVPRGEDGAVIPQFADVNGYFNAYGLVSGDGSVNGSVKSIASNSSWPTQARNSYGRRSVGSVGSGGGGGGGSDIEEDDGVYANNEEDDTYENDAAVVLQDAAVEPNPRRKTNFSDPSLTGETEVSNAVAYPTLLRPGYLSPASAIERAFAQQAGLEYDESEYHNHGAEYPGMMDDYFANGGSSSGFIEDFEIDGTVPYIDPEEKYAASTVCGDDFHLAIGTRNRNGGFATEGGTESGGDEDEDDDDDDDDDDEREERPRTASRRVASKVQLIRSGSPVYTFVDKQRNRGKPDLIPKQNGSGGSDGSNAVRFGNVKSGYTVKILGGESFSDGESTVGPDALIWDDGAPVPSQEI